MDKIAQRNRILHYMEAGGEITRVSGMNVLHIADPIKRISELREQGVPILDRWNYKLDENGKVINKYKTYYMEGVHDIS